MMKSIKLKLDPNKTQKILLNKHIGATVFVWNRYLNERKNEYLANKKTLNYYDNARDLTILKRDLVWLKEVNSQTLQAVLKDLDTAYNGFFKRLASFPKYKSKFKRCTFRIPQYTEIIGRHLKIPKFGKIRIQNKDCHIDGKIKFATISRDVSGYLFLP